MSTDLSAEGIATGRPGALWAITSGAYSDWNVNACG